MLHDDCTNHWFKKMIAFSSLIHAFISFFDRWTNMWLFTKMCQLNQKTFVKNPFTATAVSLSHNEATTL